jgi:hypothetical protein
MAQFQEGQEKPEGSGRKVGAPNKKTMQLHAVFEELGLSVPERILELLPKLTPIEQTKVLLELMPYLYPKRKAVEISSFSDDKFKPLVNIYLPEKNNSIA